MTDYDPSDRFDIPDEREPEHRIPEAVCDVQTPLKRTPHPDAALSFDEAEAAGVDGTLRSIGSMPRFYFTFGRAYSLRDNYVVITAPDRDTARRMMQDVYGRNYAFDYDETSFLPQIDQYGYTEVPFGRPSIQEHPL